MKQFFLRSAAICFAALMLCTACTAPANDSAPTALPQQTDATPQAAEPAVVPENGQPDYAGYPHLDAIAAYQKTDWTANWIWTKGCSDDSYVAFRKTFTLDAATEGTAYISAVDKYVLWLNGELCVLDGSLKRGPSPMDSYYDELTLPLKAGENTVALLVAFNGRSGDGSIVPKLVNADGDEENQAGLLFELHAAGAVIASGADWKVQRHHGYKNRATGGEAHPRYENYSALAERNVVYLAADDIGAFYAPDYDDSAWENATLIAKPGDLPFGALYRAMTDVPQFGEPIDFADAAAYLGKPLAADTTLTLALDENRQFTWVIELEAEAGKRLTVYTDTYTDREGIANFKDTYYTAAGAQHYENYPWRSGSKLILEAEAGVTFTRIAYRPSGAAGAQTGAFTSSDAALEQVYAESLNTIAICMRDTFMDCPERERGPYMGDAANQIDAALYGYDQAALNMTKKAILACIAWTPDSGAIPSRAPSNKPQEIPIQSLAFLTAAYHYWQHSGDAETMTAYYRVFVPYLKLYEMGENGMPKFHEGSWSWTDWAENPDTEMLQAGMYAYALRLTRQLADELGIADDNAFLDERYASMKANWRAAYTTEDGFRSAGAKVVDDRANALLVLSGLAEESDYEAIAAVLTGTQNASPFTEKFVEEALCVMGRTDLALERIRVRYAPMLADEWTTLWERFDEVGTYNHGWTAGPLYILSKYAAGIRPTEAGWASYEIVPTDALEAFDCSVWTPRGTIHVVKAGSELTVTAIDGGTLVLPNGETHALSAGTSTFSIEERSRNL